MFDLFFADLDAINAWVQNRPLSFLALAFAAVSVWEWAKRAACPVRFDE